MHGIRTIKEFDRVHHMTDGRITHHDCRIGDEFMPNWLGFIAFLAVYIVLMRWVLPRLGVPT